MLSLEDVKQRQQWAIQKEKEQNDKKKIAKMKRLEQEFAKTFKELGCLGPNLMQEAKTSRQKTKS